jgi:carboxyl-terminal processing protease
MKKVTLISLLLICWMISLTTSCKKDSPAPVVVKDATSAKDSLSLEINQFIWYGLSGYYLWTDSVANLSTSKWVTLTNLDNYLKTYTDHEKLFNSLLYTLRDKWSWIVSDYTTLEQQFQGITQSMGYEFGLLRIGTADQIIGYVKYVIKGSPAEKAGLKRGDIFIKVNGYTITTSNYQTLLFNSLSYHLSLATISNNTITPNNIDISMIATDVYEDPIYLDTVYNVNGTKVGYLVYNGFISNYDLELNNVFKNFKSQGIQQLILDLRYNPGGSIQTAKYLASMIYSTNTNLVLLKTQYNNNLESYLTTNYGSGYFNQYFEDSIRPSGLNPGALISSLNLSKICIIATGNTASASELVINGLKPYITVSLIGSNTVGKYVGSITVYDYDNNGIFDSIAGAKVNPKHKWAMQPIILKIANSQGQSDYYNGFTPDYAISEYDYLGNFLPFGDRNEPLLNAAINNLMGYPQKKSYQVSAYEHIADSRENIPHYNEMYFFPRDLKLNGQRIRKDQKGKLSVKR